MAYSREDTMRRTFGSMLKLPSSFMNTVGATLRAEPKYVKGDMTVVPGSNADKYVEFVRTDSGIVGIMGGIKCTVFGRE